ncbi:proton-conducting transporter transmembrane domain-containing protein [Candidatus Hakubella thermalkaliphila]|nr:proton-conducting transporter membrane subunit [Candidatus Hakubella thermalkaliphila]
MLVDYKLFLPEALLTLGFLLTVFLVLMFPGRRRISFLPVAALAGVAVHLGFSYDNYGSTLNGLLTIDPPTVILRSVGVFLGISLILVLVITARRREEDFGYRLILLTLLMVGVFVLFTSSHLVSLFLALELIAGPGYLLAMGGQKSLGEASTRFLLLGIFSSLLIAFGFSFLFGLTNQATFNEIAISDGLGRPALLAAAFLVMLGLLIKIGAFPLQGALLELVPRASSVVFILLIAVNLPLFVLILLKLAHELFFAATDYSFWLVGFFSVLTMVGGNVLSLQSSRVRMSLTGLALAHGGVIMAGYLLAVEGSFLFVLLYVPLMMLTLISIGLILSALEKEGTAELLTDLSGLVRRNAPLSIALALLLFFLGLMPLFLSYYTGLTWIFYTTTFRDPPLFLAIIMGLSLLALLVSSVSLIARILFFRPKSTEKIPVPRLTYLHSMVSVIVIGGILVLGMLDVTRWLPYFSYVVKTFLLAP